MKYNIENLIERIDAGERLCYLLFWGHQTKNKHITRACLSQWYPCQFEVDGITYNCAEQYMMAEKARVFEDEETLMQILSTDDPKEIKALGRRVKNFSIDKWSKLAKEVVLKGNMNKFGQNDDLFDFLCYTNNSILAEASPYDTIWGIGMDESDKDALCPRKWTGLNQLGFILMEVRDILLERPFVKQPDIIAIRFDYLEKDHK